jgi:hypothetical protein
MNKNVYPKLNVWILTLPLGFLSIILCKFSSWLFINLIQEYDKDNYLDFLAFIRIHKDLNHNQTKLRKELVIFVNCNYIICVELLIRNLSRQRQQYIYERKFEFSMTKKLSNISLT